MSLASPVPPPNPNARRLPRRDDKVVKAPYARNDCVDGVVLTYAGDRVNVRTGGKHGSVSLPFERFTWSPHRKAWVCWPQEVIRTLKKHDQEEPRLARRLEHAQVGQMIRVNGRVTWVKRHLGQPVPFVGLTTINAIRAYVVTSACGDLTLEAAHVFYDSDKRMWIARDPALDAES